MTAKALWLLPVRALSPARLSRVLLAMLLALGVARVGAYLLYAGLTLPLPLEVFHLEAKMVLLAYRVEVGERFYPLWRGYPHVTNFYGPVYFGLTGLLGRLIDADIPALFRIGRGITFASSLATAFVLGGVISRRDGRGAGLAGALMSLGAVPMVGFSVMVRPDALAELIGLVGFFLTGHRARAGRIAGCAALILAIMTKQTAVVLLLAALLATAAEGRGCWRRALGMLAGSLAALFVILAAVSLYEPNFVPSLAGESMNTRSLATWRTILRTICTRSPDLLILPVIGLGLWLGRDRSPWEARAAALTLVLLASSLGLSIKGGADINYYLNLRAAEALAVGTLWHEASAARGGRRRSVVLLGVLLLAVSAAAWGTWSMAIEAYQARELAEFLEAPAGRQCLGTYRKIIALARDPKVRLLTDSGFFALFQGTRAEFDDPFLFRVLVETGQIQPTRMRARIDSQDYDLIVTTADVFSKDYDTYPYGLPRTLAERVKARYVPSGGDAALFFYRRREGGLLPPPRHPSSVLPRAGSG